MELVVSVTLSIACGLFWMWWYYRQDIWDKEPIRFVALVFVLSMPLSALAGLLEYTLDQGTGQLSEKSGFFVAALFYLGIVAVIEELAKFMVVFTIAYPNRAFNEPMDGIVYAAAAALGFASFENVFYVLDKGPLVLLLRGPFSTLGHVLFSALWGAALGLALREQKKRRRRRMIATGLLLSILAHGTYNILISLNHPFFGPHLEWLALTGLIFLVGLYFAVSRLIRYALQVSQFNPNRLQPARVRPAPITRHYAPNPNRYRFQGSVENPRPATPDPTTEDCPNCGRPNLVDSPDHECYNCGNPISRQSEEPAPPRTN